MHWHITNWCMAIKKEDSKKISIWMGSAFIGTSSIHRNRFKFRESRMCRTFIGFHSTLLDELWMESLGGRDWLRRRIAQRRGNRNRPAGERTDGSDRFHHGLRSIPVRKAGRADLRRRRPRYRRETVDSVEGNWIYDIASYSDSI